MIFILYLVLSLSVYFSYKALRKVWKLIINQLSFNKASKKYININDKIANFLYKDDNITKYKEKALEYRNILFLNESEAAIEKDYIKYYNDSYERLYALFKDVIPELLQEEREKKLNKILVV